MASIAMMLGGAIANALAFTGSSFLFSKLSKNEFNKERKRHDLAVERLQKAQVEWQHKRQQRLDFINKKLMQEKEAQVKFEELDDAMRKYSMVFGKNLESLPSKPRLSDFYTPSDDQHEKELVFIAISMLGIFGVLWYIEK